MDSKVEAILNAICTNSLSFSIAFADFSVSNVKIAVYSVADCERLLATGIGR